MKHPLRLGLAIVCVLATSAAALAADKSDKKAIAAPASSPPSDVYDVLYARYLESARRPPPAPTAGPSIDWIASLGLDRRARLVNDLVTIRVVESIEGAGSADSALDKKSSATAGVGGLFGLTKKIPSIDPGGLAKTSSDSKFEGSGATSRSGTLSATITARVLEVLPNGDLVLEGAREIDINGDRQMVVLTGVARPRDVSDQNVVLSPSIGQLRIRYFGRGLMKDNLKPGWLIRVLNKVF
ncbi:MAG: flagellar basal body L-ring protein FlgH [Vicinamibacteraceae bacterium]